MAAKPNLAAAIGDTANNMDPGDSDELAQARNLLALAAKLTADGNTEDAGKAVKAASDLIQGEATDGDADENQWKPLLAQLQQHQKALAATSTSSAMDSAIRNRARRPAP